MSNPAEIYANSIYDKLPVDLWNIVADILHFDISPSHDSLILELRPCRAFIYYGDGRVSPCVAQ